MEPVVVSEDLGKASGHVLEEGVGMVLLGE
jgi:hypothetical protein